MTEHKFTEWMKWPERIRADGIQYPGIYICAISQVDLAGIKFKWSPEIIYIGMTNSLSGLKGRLKQFDNTIAGKTGHGGADRVRYKHQSYDKLIPSLYVSVAPFTCSVISGTPDDLRVMGNVAKFEYDCFAQFKELFGELPEFNNKKLSPKYSLTYGRSNHL